MPQPPEDAQPDIGTIIIPEEADALLRMLLLPDPGQRAELQTVLEMPFFVHTDFA